MDIFDCFRQGAEWPCAAEMAMNCPPAGPNGVRSKGPLRLREGQRCGQLCNLRDRSPRPRRGAVANPQAPSPSKGPRRTAWNRATRPGV
jgi:hypothetical protein